MSVVEKAIRKLQEQKQQAGGEGAHGAPPPAQMPPAEPPAPQARAAAAPGQPGIVLERGALRAAGLLPPEEDMTLLSRQYRKIKHPLLARAIGRGAPREPKGYLILIASAMPGEGKTFTALNLALSLAMEKDLKVLLVDGDVAKPQLTHVLGLTGSPGLLDALRQPDLDVESLIRPTDVPALSFLPAGAGTEEATELLSGARMERTTEQLGEQGARIVVFDSPPLLQTTESPALARMAGQVVVVVRAESTPQPVVLDALKTLEGHPSVSLVLNQSLRVAAGAYYYYGYGGERAKTISAA